MFLPGNDSFEAFFGTLIVGIPLRAPRKRLRGNARGWYLLVVAVLDMPVEKQ